ncbi:hypothetical protein [Aridibaculum aurantiacum]|uniref:hypothetical protein n=1 Tax=Aridibaculum aurantiacum TaxID=2810307 RepID=UPI001A95AA32|nr:hypothetical protein [Aridibaculum aurantiacum]
MLLLLALVVFICNACKQKQPAQHSFYYWKTSFSADSTAKHFIKKHDISHFYIRLFDIDWNYQQWMPVPRAELSVSQHAAPYLQGSYTPVIYITQQTFMRLTGYWRDSLPHKVRNRILFLHNKLSQANVAAGGPALPEPAEIQFDCDWTETTRDDYFNFLRYMKSLFPGKTISATIRLYPYKYHHKMGLPPVDKGLLMCYNMSNIKHAATTNSVFDIKDLEQYLTISNYPLPLDVALPVFGWYAWFQQNNFKGLLHDAQFSERMADSNHFVTTNQGIQVKEDIEVGAHYLRQGDVLRVEYPSEAALEEAAKLLRQKVPSAKRIALYHYDPQLVQRYEQAIKKIFTAL